MCRTLLVALFIGASAAVLAQETPVAQIRSTLVFLRDLDPPQSSPDAATLQRARRERLSGMVWAAVKDEFCRDHDCAPTEQDLEQFESAMSRQKESSIRELDQRIREFDAQIAEAPAGSARRTKLEKERQLHASSLESLRTTPAVMGWRIEETWVGSWKFFRELHRAYGGRVIFQQAGPEPLEAMRKVLEEQEMRGTYAIYDPALRKAFWEYYVSMGHNAMPDGAAFLEKPWWLHPRPPRR